jgi:hypothetical protein
LVVLVRVEVEFSE